MTQSSVAELRLAAKHARDLAEILDEPAVKRGFMELAIKWNAEAAALEGEQSWSPGQHTV